MLTVAFSAHELTSSPIPLDLVGELACAFQRSTALRN